MPDLSRRDFLRYAVWSSAVAGGGLLSSSALMGKKGITAHAAVEGDKPFALCISDVHIGERYGGVTGNPGRPNRYLQVDSSDKKRAYVRREFIEFLKACKSTRERSGKIQYLIILGDMWDMAMNNQADSFALSTILFRHLNEQDKGIGLGDLFEKVIYVPGNHDHHFWEMLQEKYWVTERVEKGLIPLEMPKVAALTVDMRTGDVSHEDKSAKDGKIPLHNPVSSLLGLDGATPVYVGYPHIFLKKQEGKYIFLTHGHLFEPDWNMVTMMFGDLMKKNGIPMTIRNIEMFNAITTELHSYSLGQTPPYKFWEKMYDLHFNKQAPAEWEKGIKEILEAHFYLRRDTKLDDEPKTRSKKYHAVEALQAERDLVEHYLTQAAKEHLPGEAEITTLIYGHTHVPSYGDTFVRYENEIKKPLKIYNTGGWVDIDPETFHMPQPMLVFADGGVGPLHLQKEG